MNVKKIFISLLVAIIPLAFEICCHAAVEVKITSVQDNIISVSGDAQSYEYVSLTVLNPGYTEEDLVFGDLTYAVQYFEGKKAGQNGFDFSVKLYDTTADGGGEFTILLTVGEQVLEPIELTFYFYEKKLDIIYRLNQAGDVSDIETYSLNNHELFKNGNAGAIASSIYMLRGASPNGQFAADADAAYITLQNAILMTAFNASNTSLLVEDGFLKYTDSLLNITDTQEYKDYANDLSTAGRNNFNSALINGTYKNIEEIKDIFKELIAYYGIVSNKNLGYGHIDTYFTNYRDVYIEYGFELSKLTNDKKTQVYTQLLKSGASNLAELAQAFNSLIPPSGYGGSGDGRNIKSGTPSINITTAAYDAYLPPAPPNILFADLRNFHWAQEAITALAQRGAITGKSEEIFAPEDNITREEFVKIVVSTMGLDIDNTEECRFSDITNDWSKPYITVAVKAGIINGVSEETFAPADNITREQGTVILYRALIYMGKAIAPTTILFGDDTDISDWAKESVYALKGAGVISGRGNNLFVPMDFMNRAEAAKMIYSIIHKD